MCGKEEGEQGKRAGRCVCCGVLGGMLRVLHTNERERERERRRSTHVALPRLLAIGEVNALDARPQRIIAAWVGIHAVIEACVEHVRRARGDEGVIVWQNALDRRATVSR